MLNILLSLILPRKMAGLICTRADRQTRAASAAQRLRSGRLSGMYGLPLNCKRKMSETRLVCANVYGLHWSKRTPDHDGIRYALFPFSYAVLEDFFQIRVLRAPDLTVVPSHGSPANLAGNHKLLSCRQSFSGSGDERSPIGFPGSQYRPSHPCQFIG